MAKKKIPEIKSLYYITHIENLPSILERGIFSHQLIEEQSLKFTPIYDVSIVSNRKAKLTPNGKSLWEFANLYFQPRNPMLYRVIHEKGEKELAIIGVQKQAMDAPDVFLTDGNAANDPTSFFTPKEGLKAIYKMWDIIDGEWWNSVDGSKRKIMAECLVPRMISSDLIHTIYVASHAVAEKVRSLPLPRTFPVVPEPNMFFIPAKHYPISTKLAMVEGDMFFSKCQTLTVSVNTVGIMGKGLASRAKYQFPDVYVTYQDACRKKALKMGKPFLYKREAPFDDELADDPATLSVPNGVKWFLMFATKRHWRDNSDLQGIDEGLQWLVENYKTEGIKSIALPALGCGLGNLPWKDVGPIMCRRLSALQIPVFIYLPREREIPIEQLSSEYLLGKTLQNRLL
jgi:hypothetical protein